MRSPVLTARVVLPGRARGRVPRVAFPLSPTLSSYAHTVPYVQYCRCVSAYAHYGIGPGLLPTLALRGVRC
eukprot:3136496-Rhodomonas_salina.9